MKRRILKERFEGSKNEIYLKFFVGVDGVHELDNYKKWDSTEIGDVRWEQPFDIYSFEGENKVLALCDDLRVFNLTRETAKTKRRTRVTPISN